MVACPLDRSMKTGDHAVNVRGGPMLAQDIRTRYSRVMFFLLVVFVVSTTSVSGAAANSEVPAQTRLSLAVFDIDATPPVGSLMAYDRVTNKWDLGLRARGVVLLGAGQPIVLCAVDWIGIANEAYDTFRAGLAQAAGTIPSRVALHCLHQHDAPDCDFSAEKVL